MNKLISILIIVIFFSCEQTNPRLYMVGDSTMSNKPDLEFPERGWGQILPMFFDSSFVIENHAQNGRSSRSFRYEGRWDSVISKVKPGDFVVIQFGHNDDVETKIGRHSTIEEYSYNLKEFANKTLEKGAYPILCTPIIRRNFVGGELLETHGEYPNAVKKVASELNVPLIDLHAMSKELVLSLGEEKSIPLFLHIQPGLYKNTPNGKTDNTHLSGEGATKIASLFVLGIKEQNLQLIKYLKNE